MGLSNQEEKKPTKEYVVNTARLGHSLPEIDFVGSFCCAGDKPEDIQIFHEYKAILLNTTKPFLYSAPGRFHTQKFMEMAAIVSGGEQELRRRPSIGIFTETVSPMKVGKYSEETIEAAEMGVSVIVALAPMMGATSPSTKAGTLAQSNAEALFGVYLTQIIKPGSEVLFGPGTGSSDMKIARMVRCILEGVDVNQETLTVDVIQEAGCHGNYLTHPHTARV